MPSRYVGFILESTKVLIMPPESPPQHPHTDNHCTSCVVCIVHLLDEQDPMSIVMYHGVIDYPMGITVMCDGCNRRMMLPNANYQHSVHLTDEEGWKCRGEGGVIVVLCHLMQGWAMRAMSSNIH